MKIIEKKCPNCHANLEFDVGEVNVKCPNCRRAYAIEYDKDFVDPEVQLKAKDIQLKLMGDFEKARKFHKVFFIIVLCIIAAVFIITAIAVVHGFSEYQETKRTIDAGQEWIRKRSEEMQE